MTITYNDHLPSLDFSIQDFLLERKVRRVSPRTIEWHERSLRMWKDYCHLINVQAVEEVTPRALRLFILSLQDAGYKRNGVSNVYRSVKAFFLWYESEYETGWKSPTRKVKVPAGDDEPLEPLSLAHFVALLAACGKRSLVGDRDRAILYTLLDTGIRRAEIIQLRASDVNLATGEIYIQRGKGGKQRMVIAGNATRRALLHYLRWRGQLAPDAPLWIARTGAKLTDSGLRQIIRRRAKAAGIPEPGLHSFRRAFAINYLRNGGDVITLQRLLGHADLSVINRYLKLVTSDLQIAHAEYGIVDNL